MNSLKYKRHWISVLSEGQCIFHLGELSGFNYLLFQGSFVVAKLMVKELTY